MSDLEFEIAILGAGPGGLSAAARAAQRGLSYVLLEAGDKHANTIQQYQRRKHIMAEPCSLPLRSDLDFAAGRREEVLSKWEERIDRDKFNIRYRAQAVTIKREAGGFTIAFEDGKRVRSQRVILALGIQGNPRRLGVPGDDHPSIQSALECAEDHCDETIVVVGAGDSAIENALALSRQNKVVLVNRNNGFPRAKDANATRVRNAVDAARLQCLYETTCVRVVDEGGSKCRISLMTPDGEISQVCDRVITRLGSIAPRRFIEPIGVRYLGADADALPDLSTHYESSVPGLFIIGALAGYPLIKQALNQGYEVIEHLSGHEVEPADHAILARKLSAVPFGHDVEATLQLIRERVQLFRNVSSLILRELVMASTVRILEAGNEVFVRGEYLATAFNVLQGVVYLQRPDEPPLMLHTGQLFGTVSLISGRPCEATAVAGPDCVVLETPQRMLKKLMRTERPAREFVDRIYILRALKFLLSGDTAPSTIDRLAKTARIHRLDAEQPLFSQGEVVDRVYLVRRGSVTLSRNTGGQEVVVAYCAPGRFVDCVGEMSGSTLRAVTARATVATEALSIDHSTFVRELAHDAALMLALKAQRVEQLEHYTRMQARPEAGRIMSFLMSQGVGEATSILVIDEALCVGCDQCETACASTHQGIARLDRRAGPTYLSLHIPTSCRHCEHPHCMSDCPADAIHKKPDGEVYIDDSCIGCGNCEENCPYGVIQMAELPATPSLIDRLLNRPPSEPAKTAVKCDSCVGVKAGPACVNACPTGAAIRIHADEVVHLAQKRVAAF